MRDDKRSAEDLRPVSFETGFIEHHKGSVLVSFGNTKVITTAISEDRVPQHRERSGGGWLSAEYNMLPGSTFDRKHRASSKGRPDGRSVEIQRLIGRSLRQAIDLDKIGPRSIFIDCDVLQADGGTRTAAITGAWVALALCIRDLIEKKKIRKHNYGDIILRQVAAVSLGIFGEEVYTDLCYKEDVAADTDFNIVGCNDGTIVELQGTAEAKPMTKSQIDLILQRGILAIQHLCQLQMDALKL